VVGVVEPLVIGEVGPDVILIRRREHRDHEGIGVLLSEAVRGVGLLRGRGGPMEDPAVEIIDVVGEDVLIRAVDQGGEVGPRESAVELGGPVGLPAGIGAPEKNEAS
jgi:hypothetical protein